MKISIIIPTLNEEKLLPDLLKSIKRQKFKDYEVIVADADSTDKTRQIAQKHGAKIVPGGKPGRARNNGAKAAQGEFLYFFDADVVLPPDFLQKSWDEIFERYLELASCNFKPLSDRPIDQVLHGIANNYIALSQFSQQPLAGGACILISRRLFERVGGFDEKLVLTEDHDLIERAAKFRHFRILFSTEILISVRRLEKEGRVGISRKYLQTVLHKGVFGKVNSQIFKYDFADYAVKNNSKEEKELLKIDVALQKIADDISARVKKFDQEQHFINLEKLGLEQEKRIQDFIKLFD